METTQGGGSESEDVVKAKEKDQREGAESARPDTNSSRGWWSSDGWTNWRWKDWRSYGGWSDWSADSWWQDTGWNGERAKQIEIIRLHMFISHMAYLDVDVFVYACCFFCVKCLVFARAFRREPRLNAALAPCLEGRELLRLALA